jgi:hypothetical protein
MSKRGYWYGFVGLIAAYAAAVFLLPADPEVLEKYHLSEDAARFINLTVILPLVGIWLAGFYGWYKMKQYAASVAGSAEGTPFNTIANGLMTLIFSLPLISAVSTLLTYAARTNPDFLAASTIIRNYLNIAFVLIAFYLIGKGAQQLVQLTRTKTLALDNRRWTLLFMALASIFTWLVISHTPGDGRQDTVYYLPEWLVIFTIVLPYLYIWYRGLLAAYCLYVYQQKVKGVLYKQALKYLSAGIAAVIGISMGIQILIVFTERINTLHLTPVLGLIYVLVACYAIGYGLIARGAKKLKTIEDV